MLAAAPALAHPSRGIVVAADGRVYFSDIERVWMIPRDGDAVLLRTNRNAHTHALALDPSGRLRGEESTYDPADGSYREAIWERNERGTFRYVHGPTKRLARGVGLTRDHRGCTYHVDQARQDAGPLVHRKCPGGPATLLAGSVADDRAFKPVLVNDVAGTALAADGALVFRQGDALYKLSPRGRLVVLASGLARENFGVALDRKGRVHLAEMRNRRILRIDASGRRATVARSKAPWFPTGVALAGGAYVLLETTDHRAGTKPRVRVRRVEPGGAARVLASIG